MLFSCFPPGEELEGLFPAPRLRFGRDTARTTVAYYDRRTSPAPAP